MEECANVTMCKCANGNTAGIIKLTNEEVRMTNALTRNPQLNQPVTKIRMKKLEPQVQNKASV
jgi:hypothetical protein